LNKIGAGTKRLDGVAAKEADNLRVMIENRIHQEYLFLEQADAFLRSEMKKWAEVVAATGIKAQ